MQTTEHIVAYIGSAEQIMAVMFGPFQHDAHVRERAAHLEAGTLTERLRRADAAVRAECERMSAEFRAKCARNNPSFKIAAE